MINERYDGDLEWFFAQVHRGNAPRPAGGEGGGPGDRGQHMPCTRRDKPVFVIDAYTFRILGRHGLAEAGHGLFRVAGACSWTPCPQDVPMFNQFHAMLVQAGQGPLQKDQPPLRGLPGRGLASPWQSCELLRFRAAKAIYPDLGDTKSRISPEATRSFLHGEAASAERDAKEIVFVRYATCTPPRSHRPPAAYLTLSPRRRFVPPRRSSGPNGQETAQACHPPPRHPFSNRLHLSRAPFPSSFPDIFLVSFLPPSPFPQ